jgi:hypothetical protein
VIVPWHEYTLRTHVISTCKPLILAVAEKPGLMVYHVVYIRSPVQKTVQNEKVKWDSMKEFCMWDWYLIAWHLLIHWASKYLNHTGFIHRQDVRTYFLLSYSHVPQILWFLDYWVIHTLLSLKNLSRELIRELHVFIMEPLVYLLPLKFV